MDDQGFGLFELLAVLFIAFISGVAACSHLADITIGEGAGNYVFTGVFVVLLIIVLLILRWMKKKS